MTESTVIPDLASARHLGPLCEWAQDGRPIPLSRLQALVCRSASTPATGRYGVDWLAWLVSAAERGGVGHLERRGQNIVFQPSANVPSLDEAWARVQASWPEPEAASPA
jgi:hypothetical protein